MLHRFCCFIHFFLIILEFVNSLYSLRRPFSILLCVRCMDDSRAQQRRMASTAAAAALRRGTGVIGGRHVRVDGAAAAAGEAVAPPALDERPHARHRRARHVVRQLVPHRPRCAARLMPAQLAPPAPLRCFLLLGVDASDGRCRRCALRQDVAAANANATAATASADASADAIAIAIAIAAAASVMQTRRLALVLVANTAVVVVDFGAVVVELAVFLRRRRRNEGRGRAGDEERAQSGGGGKDEAHLGGHELPVRLPQAIDDVAVAQAHQPHGCNGNHDGRQAQRAAERKLLRAADLHLPDDADRDAKN